MDAIKYVKYVVKCLELITEKHNDDDRENCLVKVQISKIKSRLFMCPAIRFARTKMSCDSHPRHLDKLSAHNRVVLKHSRIM